MTSPIDRLFRRDELSPIAVGLTIAGVLALLHVTNPDIHAHFGKWESAFYVRSALNPLQSPIDPHYGYRLLPGLLIRAMPFDMKFSYLLANYVCLYGAAFLLYRILVFEKIRPVFALWAGIVFLAAKASTKYLLAFSSGQDALFLLLLALGYRCIQLERWKSLVLVLCMGVLNKVAILALFFPAIVSGLRLKDRGPSTALKKVLGLAGVILPPVIIFIGIRLVFPPEDTGYTFLRDVQSNLHLKFVAGSKINESFPHIIEVPIAFYVVYGMAAVVMIFFSKDILSVARGHHAMTLLFAALSTLTFIGSYDNSRCQIYLFIPVLYLYCRIMERKEEFFRQWYVLGTVVLLQVYSSNLFNLNPAYYEAFMPHYMTGDQAMGYFRIFALSLAALAACWTIYRFFQRRTGLRSSTPSG